MQAGQYSNYPRPVRNDLSFSVIGESWTVIKGNLGPFVVAAILALIAIAVPSYLGSFLFLATPESMRTPSDLPTMIRQQLLGNAITIPFTLLGYALAGPILASIVHMTFKALSGQAVEVGDVGWGFRRFLPLALASLITTVLVTIGSYLFCIPGLIAGGLTLLVIPTMVVQGMSPFDALSFSFSRMTKFLFMASLLYLVLYFVSGLGILLCCVGIVLTYPIGAVGSALVYRDVVGFQQPTMAAPAPAPEQPSPGPSPEDPGAGQP
jgi:uncharacterized membrane protein